MKFKTIFLTLVTLAAAAGHAQERTVSDTLPSAQFDALDPAKLSPAKIEFSQRLQEFQDWIATNSAESKVMNLYDGFKEPVVNYTNANGQPDTLTDSLVMYITSTKTVLNKGAAQINLAKMIDLGTINSIDPELKSRQVGPAELMNNVIAAKQPVKNFDWCNNGTDDIVKPKKRNSTRLYRWQKMVYFFRPNALHRVLLHVPHNVENCFEERRIEKLGNFIHHRW